MAGKTTIPFGKGISGNYTPPPSKSHTIRALLIASLAEGESRIHSPSLCDDAKYLKKIIEKWRTLQETDERVVIRQGGTFPPEGGYYVGGSATAARFLLALFSFMEGERTIDGDETLRRRALGAGIDSARALGAGVLELEEKGHLPITIKGNRSAPGSINITDTISSQFISGLLTASPLRNSGMTVGIGETVSMPYIHMTLNVMKQFGVGAEISGDKMVISPGIYRGAEIEIEKDFSAASFFFAGAGISGNEIVAAGLQPGSIQGDSAVVGFLEGAGMEIAREGPRLKIKGSPTSGFDIDLAGHPDLFPPLAVLSLKCPGPSRFRGTGRLETKESGRGSALAAAINKIGGNALVEEDLITIKPQREYRGSVLDPENDHRLAMAFSMMGLLAKGTSVLNPECVKKSYPAFWDDFFKLLS